MALFIIIVEITVAFVAVFLPHIKEAHLFPFKAFAVEINMTDIKAIF